MAGCDDVFYCVVDTRAWLRDPKVLRTLVLLELESHPPSAGIDRVKLTIDPTPGRIIQHSLLARPLPSPSAARATRRSDVRILPGIAWWIG